MPLTRDILLRGLHTCRGEVAAQAFHLAALWLLGIFVGALSLVILGKVLWERRPKMPRKRRKRSPIAR